MISQAQSLSQDGIDKLILREGERLKAYKDTKGIWTIGIGDTDINNDGIRDVGPGMSISKLNSRENFKADVQWAEDCVNTNVNAELKQCQFDALVSFAFNIGASAFKYSTMVRKLNAGDVLGASKEFDRWRIPKEIIGRRNSERDQFNGK